MTDDLPEFFARVALDEVNQLVVVSGELDLVNAAHLGECLDAVIDSTDGDVVVDLANVTFIDSTGLRTVLVARDRLCRSDRTLAVRNPSVQVARLLEICGLCDLIELKHSGEAGAQDAAEPTADVVRGERRRCRIRRASADTASCRTRLTSALVPSFPFASAPLGVPTRGSRGCSVMTIGVVVHTGKRLGSGPGALRSALADAGVTEPYWSEIPKSKKAPKHVRELLDAGVDRLLVWGGDGTVRRCIDTIVAENAKIEVAILPAGTANLLARAVEVPADLEKAVDIAVNGVPRPIDIGVINGKAFAVMAGTGFDARMIRDTDTAAKNRMGWWSYLRAGVRNLGEVGTAVTVDVDGERWFEGAASCVLVGNVGRILGGVSVFPAARFDDGRLDVGVLTARSRVEWLRVGLRAVVGRTDASPFVDMTQATTVTVHLDDKMPWQLDGSARSPAKSFEVSVLPARRPDPDGGDVSGAVEIVGQPTLRRNDHWVRSWPLGRSTLVPLATNVALLLAVTSSIGLLFMWYLDQGPVGDADRAVAEWLEDHRTENLNTLTHYGSMLSDTLVKVALVVLTGGAAILMWRRWHDGVFIALAVIVESTVFVLASFIVGRDRPPVEQLDPPAPSGSFPSGHTAAAVAFYGAVFIVACWHTRSRLVRVGFFIVAVAAPLIVGFSRAARGMHHPIDVIAGLLLGLAALAVTRHTLAKGVAEIDRTAGPSTPARLRHLDLTEPGAS